MKSFVLTVFFSLFLLLAACIPADKQVADKPIHSTVDSVDGVHLSTANCIAGLIPCVHTGLLGDFSVAVNVERIVMEQPFNLFLTYRGAEQIKAITGYLEGKHMYMGKIPLLFEPMPDKLDLASTKKSHTYVSEIMLGMCSQPQMTWQIVLFVEFVKTPNRDEFKQHLRYDLQSNKL